ncbi:hypothetical protein ACWDNR_26930, partial [Gordonia aichiensis]
MQTGIARVITAAAVACLAWSTAACAPDTASAAEVVGAPRSDFYSPPAESIPGPHGSVIRTQPVTGSQAVPGARNFLVLYRSVDAQGRPVAVSGTLAGGVPSGTASVPDTATGRP